jgi:hypothetical protein
MAPELALTSVEPTSGFTAKELRCPHGRATSLGRGVGYFEGDTGSRVMLGSLAIGTIGTLPQSSANEARQAIKRSTWMLAAVALLLGGMGQATAGIILYYNDFSLGTDRMSQALFGGTNFVTTATSLSDFQTKIATGQYQLGILFEQNNSGPAYDAAFAALANHIAQGGLAIATDWSRNGTHSSAFQTGFTGGFNQSSFTILDPSLGTGVTNPVSLTNPGWGVFSTDLSTSGATVAARFADSTGAIVEGNGGRTIWNGFLSDTFASGPDGVQLYTNEINSLFASQAPAAAPEPATVTMAGIGIVSLLGYGWRRHKLAAA